MAAHRSWAKHHLPLILALLSFGLESPLPAQLRGSSAYKSPRSLVALEFLNRLESGRTAEAYRMLTANARNTYSLSALKAPRRDPGVYRKVMFEGPVSQFDTQQRAAGRYYIVCIIDAPKGGGAVTHIAVTVMTDPVDSQLHVADYRYDSRQHPACASRV